MVSVSDRIRGDDWSIQVTITSVSDGVSTPVNLTGATQIKATIATDDGVVVYTGNATAPTPANGVVVVNVPKATTATITPDVYLGDVQVDFASGARQSVKYKVRVGKDQTI